MKNKERGNKKYFDFIINVGRLPEPRVKRGEQADIKCGVGLRVLFYKTREADLHFLLPSIQRFAQRGFCIARSHFWR